MTEDAEASLDFLIIIRVKASNSFHGVCNCQKYLRLHSLVSVNDV